MKKGIFLFVAVLLLTGCSTTMAKHKNYVKDGVFITGLSQSTFLEEWGKPDKKGHWYTEGGQTRLEIGCCLADISGKRCDLNDVCIYYSQNKIMFFRNHRLAVHYDWDKYQEVERATIRHVRLSSNLEITN